MDASSLLAEVPFAVRDLVLGHWPVTSVEGTRCHGDAYLQTGVVLNDSADQYEAEACRVEQAIDGATQAGLAERHRTVAATMRNQAAVCKDMGQQCHDLADSTLETQHLLVISGIVLGAQLAYDALLFFQGGGMKAVVDRLAAEQAMRAAAARLTVTVAENAAAGTARRAALHGAIHAAKIGALTSAVTSVGAQLWDMHDGIRDGFDTGSFLELLAGGVLGSIAGAEVGRRIAPRMLEWVGAEQPPTWAASQRMWAAP